MTPKVALFPGEVGYIGAGTYTEIVAVDAPSSAVAGSRVDVTIRIKNIWTDYVHVSAIGVYDSEERFIDWLDYWIPPGSTHSFSGSFIMPAKDVTIHAYSWYEGEDGYLYFDDEAERDVRLGEVVGWQLLDTRLAGVGTILPEVGWQLLDSRTLAVKSVPPVVGWQLLDSRTLAVKSVPPVVGWQLLDSRTLAVKSVPPVVGWKVLDEKTVGLIAGPPEEIPPEYELVQHTIYPFAYIYDGDVEVTTATFRTDPFTPSAWLADRFASKLEEEVRARGGRPLEVKVDVDKTPLLWTDFRIEIISTPIGGVTEAAPGIAVGIALWLAIILVCLAIIAVIVVATLAFETIMDRIQHKPGLHELKLSRTPRSIGNAP